jgi:hypothetical protein
MKKLLPLLLAAFALNAQTATRTITLTWVNTNPAGTVLSTTISTATSATGPWTQIASVTSPTLTYNDTETVGTTIYYQLYFVAAACASTTPIGTPCGPGAVTVTAAVPIPPRTAGPSSITVIVN